MINITQIDYRLQGYFKKKVNDSKGDRVTIEYYAEYDSQTGDYSRLKVKETRTYTRNTTTGILEEITVLIEWFSGDGVTVRANKTLVKPLDLDDGMKTNERSRGRLVNKAKGAAIQLIGLAAGKTFMRNLGLEISLYREGDIQPLIDAINNDSVQTQAFKDTLVGILNVSYTS